MTLENCMLYNDLLKDVPGGSRTISWCLLDSPGYILECWMELYEIVFVLCLCVDDGDVGNVFVYTSYT